MKKLLLPLLLSLGCAGSLNTEQVLTNANFILDVLQVDSVSLTCEKDKDSERTICISIDKENNKSTLYCDVNQCFMKNSEKSHEEN